MNTPSRRTLTLRHAPPGRISLAGITPDKLAVLSNAEIERLPLAWGNGKPVLGEFFAASGDGGEQLVFDGTDARFVDVAAGMSSGICIVHGDAGDFVARDMTGGQVFVHGKAGRFAACGMAGGECTIHGDAGDQLGAALPWLGGGMRGGRVVVRGNAGARCGDRMRRGEIFVEGDVGPFCATRMVAGTIVVGGQAGAHLGHAMRRGTLFLLGTPYAPAPTFVETVMCADAYLRLIWRDWSMRFGAEDKFGAFARRAGVSATSPRRWLGDLAADGRAEILAFAG